MPHRNQFLGQRIDHPLGAAVQLWRHRLEQRRYLSNTHKYSAPVWTVNLVPLGAVFLVTAPHNLCLTSQSRGAYQLLVIDFECGEKSACSSQNPGIFPGNEHDGGKPRRSGSASLSRLQEPAVVMGHTLGAKVPRLPEAPASRLPEAPASRF